jgi:hypothetical protein
MLPIPRPSWRALFLGAVLLCGSRPAPATAAHGIAVIVGRETGAMALDRRQLALIYLRKRQFWDNGMRVTPVNLPAAHPIRRAFSLAVLDHTPDEMDDFWRQQYFHGELPPYVAGSEEAAIRFVEATPGAVAYVSACSVDKRVFVVLTVGEDTTCP